VKIYATQILKANPRVDSIMNNKNILLCLSFEDYYSPVFGLLYHDIVGITPPVSINFTLGKHHRSPDEGY